MPAHPAESIDGFATLSLQSLAGDDRPLPDLVDHRAVLVFLRHLE